MKIKDYLNKNIQVYALVMLIVMSVVLLGGTSYALIQRTLRGNNTYSMQTGSFLVSFSNNNTLSLSNKLPVYDDIGMNSGDEFTFTVTNTGEYKANYSVRIEETSTEGLGEVIRYAIDKGDGYKLNNIHALANNKYIVQNKSLVVDGSDTYKLRFWIDIDAGESYANKTFSGKVVLEATQEAYKYGTNVIEAIYNQEDKEGLVAIDKNGVLHTSGDIREYRYSGNVNTNYVWFNCDNGYTSGEAHCEKWRIIGSFENTYENGVGTYRMLKIVSDEVLDNGVFNTNTGNYANFKGASIEDDLNNYYYNLFSNDTKNLIMKAKWNIGNTINTNIPSISYNSEKGSIVYDNIGLVNVSDYGYASNNTLWTNAMNANTYSLTNNWLFKENSMLLNTSSSTGTNIYLSNANLTTGTTTTNYGVRPSVYLKPDVSIIAGFGTSDSPYELGIKYPMDYGIKTEIKVQSDSLETVGQLGLTVNTSAEGCPVEGQQIKSIAGADVDLVCEYSDDDGTSYYFRGASSHNYVKWAGYYWRIIRINGDGNIRMIYAGDADTIDALSNRQEVLANGYNDSTTQYTQIGTKSFNSNIIGNAYVGLMYGDNLPDVYDTVGVVSSESVTTRALSTTGSYYCGTGYTINAKNGQMSISMPRSITITADNISDLVGKYMFASTYESSSYSWPLILVESVDSSALTVTGKQITRKLIDGLDIEETYDKTHENKKYSTIMGEADSTTTNTLNGWYNNNIKGTEYESQVADSIICNDRSLYKEEYGTKHSSSSTDFGIKGYSGTSENSGLGIGTEITAFGPYYRNYLLDKPSLKCENRNDRFTVSNSKGNQALSNPIGLISADEVILAGGGERSVNKNNGYYLYSGNDYWTSSPSYLDSGGYAFAWVVSSEGYLPYGNLLGLTYGVRPVLSLDPLRLNIEGSGTLDDPFVFNSK